jgi:hypothetical protein
VKEKNKCFVSGVLSNIKKLFSKNDCSCQKSTQEVERPQKYKCNICERMISQEHALEHAKAEEYIIKLIKKDHPQWKSEDYLCLECIDYYRKLIKDAEI